MARKLRSLRASWWALRALGRARRQLSRSGFRRVDIPAPPEVGDSSLGGVTRALRRGGASCLERALVLQRWHAAHGRPRDVVIGVARSAGAFKAHAWLDGEPAEAERPYRELTRISSR